MKIEIPEKKKLVHEMHIPIRWGDMDAMGQKITPLTSATWKPYASTGCTPLAVNLIRKARAR